MTTNQREARRIDLPCGCAGVQTATTFRLVMQGQRCTEHDLSMPPRAVDKPCAPGAGDDPSRMPRHVWMPTETSMQDAAVRLQKMADETGEEWHTEFVCDAASHRVRLVAVPCGGIPTVVPCDRPRVMLGADLGPEPVTVKVTVRQPLRQWTDAERASVAEHMRKVVDEGKRHARRRWEPVLAGVWNDEPKPSERCGCGHHDIAPLDDPYLAHQVWCRDNFGGEWASPLNATSNATGIGISAPGPAPLTVDDPTGDDVARDMSPSEIRAWRERQR